MVHATTAVLYGQDVLLATLNCELDRRRLRLAEVGRVSTCAQSTPGSGTSTARRLASDSDCAGGPCIRGNRAQPHQSTRLCACSQPSQLTTGALRAPWGVACRDNGARKIKGS